MPFRNEPLVTIATFFTPFEASLARGALEAIGIKAMVLGEAFGYFTRYKDSPPQADLQVFESDRDRAMVELRRLQMRVVDPPDDGDD
jgi:hypothetical protein